MNYAVVLLYAVITILFSINLKKLYNKYKDKNSKISFSSLLATASLIVVFSSLSVYFLFFKLSILIASQIYLLLTMLFIKFYSSREKK